MVQSLPHVPHSLAPGDLNYNQSSGSECTLSPFLLLPDSFGDIYAGEKFSAYIAVVNGFAQVPFYQVTLAVRLQTATTVIDLADIRANAEIVGSNQYLSKTLNCNETFDMIVAQTLTELGIHTLRVSVQYLLAPNTEVKTLRKFYRFNVLQPLVIQSSYVELNGKPMVQCEVTNATKSPIYIDEVRRFTAPISKWNSQACNINTSSLYPTAHIHPNKPHLRVQANHRAQNTHRRSTRHSRPLPQWSPGGSEVAAAQRELCLFLCIHRIYRSVG